MGIWDRFGHGRDEPAAASPELSADEQAIARYRYMLRTAPPEAIEQAHAEAFAALTPEQRRMVLEQLKRDMPEAERLAATRGGDSPGSLAQLATRAEIRQPGAMERIFGGVPAGPAWGAGPGLGGGLGGVMAGTFLSSMVGTVLGSMVAQHFFNNHPGANQLFGGAPDAFGDRVDTSRFDDLSRGIDGPPHGSSNFDDVSSGIDDDASGGFDSSGDTWDT
jgi:hypothetical protein